MNLKFHSKRSAYYQRLLTVVFFSLTLCFSVLITVYWALLLEPQLVVRACVTAKSVVVSNLGELKEQLDSISTQADVSRIKAIDSNLGRLLILVDSESGVSFISGLTFEVDYDVVPVNNDSLNRQKGMLETDRDNLVEIPLYSGKTKELLGILAVSVNREFVRHFIKRIKLTFFIGAGAGLLLLFVAWGLAALLLRRVRSAEKTIEEKKTQIIHTGRLTAMGEMATGIAHELNQPLAIIRIASDGILSWFKENTTPETMEHKATGTIIKQVERARDIIDHMRAFARTDSNDARWVSVSEPVNNALIFFREQFRNHGIQLNVSLPENADPVLINPQKFEQIVVNLLSNARHAVDNGGEHSPAGDKIIDVCCCHDSENQQFVFEVKDNGRGMDHEEMERCMEPFYTTKKVGEGTGLGLSIVNSIAMEAGMKIEIESSKGKGSIFRVLIPERSNST